MQKTIKCRLTPKQIYNQRVLAILDDQNPERANLLRSSGEARGWWYTLAHFYYIGMPVAKAADFIMKEKI
jgi:hypothetical protein